MQVVEPLINEMKEPMENINNDSYKEKYYQTKNVTNVGEIWCF